MSTRMTCGVALWEWEQQYADLAAHGFADLPSLSRTHPRNVDGEGIGSVVLAAMRERAAVARRAREQPVDYGAAEDGPFGGDPLPNCNTAHEQHKIDAGCFVDRMYDQIVRWELAFDRMLSKGTQLVKGTVTETAFSRSVDACLRCMERTDAAEVDEDERYEVTGDREVAFRQMYKSWYEALDTDGVMPVVAAWRKYEGKEGNLNGDDFPLILARPYKQYVGYTGSADDAYLLHYELDCKLALVGDKQCADYDTSGGVNGHPGHARVRFVPRRDDTPVVEYGPNGLVALISFEIKACVLNGPVPERLRRRQGKRRRVDASGVAGTTHAPDIGYQVMHGRVFVDTLDSTVSGRLSTRSRCDGTIEYTFKVQTAHAVTRTCITNRAQRAAQMNPFAEMVNPFV